MENAYNAILHAEIAKELLPIAPHVRTKCFITMEDAIKHVMKLLLKDIME